jgi:hypothetical protein
MRAARHLSAAALFRLNIASTGRGTLAGTRWAHFNYNDKKASRSAREEELREDQCHDKSEQDALRR